MAVNMVWEYGKVLKEILTLENGKITKYVEKACTYGKMETNMRENGKKD
jgi:hypothetical protein